MIGAGRSPKDWSSHVDPNLLYVVKAGVPRSGKPQATPAARNRSVDQPDRMLLFVVYDDDVLARIVRVSHQGPARPEGTIYETCYFTEILAR